MKLYWWLLLFFINLSVVSYSQIFNAPAPIINTQNGTGGFVGQYTSQQVVNGNPAMVYYDGTRGDLVYVRALDANGSVWGTPISIDYNGNVGTHASLQIVNGNPAVAYHDGNNLDLKYIRALDANGTTWAPPVTIDASPS